MKHIFYFPSDIIPIFSNKGSIDYDRIRVYYSLIKNRENFSAPTNK